MAATLKATINFFKMIGPELFLEYRNTNVITYGGLSGLTSTVSVVGVAAGGSGDLLPVSLRPISSTTVS